jgi:xanthine/CO dehydrogenase XdhC/CoxF family maturation factor
MRDLLNILAATTDLKTRNEPATLATVVAVEGSSYRLPGARMLIDSTGRRLGAVSGGCLEADIARRGRLLTPQNPSALIHYDGADPDTAWNLGCNGSIKILIEQTNPGPADAALKFLQTCINHRTPGVIATLFAGPITGRLTLTNTGAQSSTISDPDLQTALLFDARKSLDNNETATITYETPLGPVHALIESIHPPLPLLIFGAGHDAVPLVHYAKSLGWHVTVIDRRQSYARPDHFPQADAVIAASASEISKKITLDKESVAVIMTHHYPDDRALLEILLNSPVNYVGVLGPRSRTTRMLSETTTIKFHPKLHAPIGLDIGADGPDQVAISIIAEILAHKNHRPALPLRQRPGPIHDPVKTKTTEAQKHREENSDQKLTTNHHE